MFVVGVDGSADGWIVVALNRGRFAGASHFEQFDKLIDAVTDAEAIAVNVPVGLLPEGLRQCDALARSLLGPRAATVHNVPPRPVFEAETYVEAKQLCRHLVGKGLPKQIYSLYGRILEVEAIRAIELRHGESIPCPAPAQSWRRAPHEEHDEYDEHEHEEPGLAPGEAGGAESAAPSSPAALTEFAELGELGDAAAESAEAPRNVRPRPPGRIVEVHPEVSFCKLAGEPLVHPRKSYNGLMRRLKLLTNAGIFLPQALTHLGSVAPEAVIDAAIMAWSAQRYARGGAKTLPAKDHWQRDEHGRPVAIWV